MYIYIIWNICLLCQFHPAPSKKTDCFYRSQDLLANVVQLLFHPGKTRHLPTKNPLLQQKKMVAAKLICASKILSVINITPNNILARMIDRCVGTRAFVSSSPRRRIAPSCPPSSDGSSNNPPANHFFKRRSSMEGWGSNIKHFKTKSTIIDQYNATTIPILLVSLEENGTAPYGCVSTILFW